MTRQPLMRFAIFLLLAGVAWIVTGSAIGLLGGTGPETAPMFGAIFASLLIVLSALYRRLGGERGWPSDARVLRRRVGQLAAGFATGAALFATVTLVRGWTVGGNWQAHATPSLSGVLATLGFVLSLMLSEELLFRGYALRQLAKLCAPPVALGLSAVAFGAYHLIGSGDWALGAVFRFLMPALGGVVFGYAALRSGSLALPIGLHWGGNWIDTAILGLGHDGGSRALWIMPLEASQQRALAAPDLLPHLPYLLALAGALLIVRFALVRHPRLTNA